MLRRWIGTALLGVVCAVPALRDASAQVPTTLARFDRAGTFRTSRVTNGGFTFFVPDPINNAPIVTWGNGTFTSPSNYAALLTHFASHGFLVVAANDSNVGTGRQQMDGLRVARQMFPGLAPGACAVGHSQGGGGWINAAQNDAGISCLVAIEPEINLTSRVTPGRLPARVQFFLIGGQSDTVAPVARNAQVVFNQTNPAVKTVFGVRNGASHFVPLGNGGVFRAYVTAFLAATLKNDADGLALFRPANCGICNDPNWVVRRNFTGR